MKRWIASSVAAAQVLALVPAHAQSVAGATEYQYDANGNLTEAAIQRGLDCLKGFATQLAGLPTERVRAVATQTLREARNRDAFITRAEAVSHLTTAIENGFAYAVVRAPLVIADGLTGNKRSTRNLHRTKRAA